MLFLKQLKSENCSSTNKLDSQQQLNPSKVAHTTPANVGPLTTRREPLSSTICSLQGADINLMRLLELGGLVDVASGRVCQNDLI